MRQVVPWSPVRGGNKDPGDRLREDGVMMDRPGLAHTGDVRRFHFIFVFGMILNERSRRESQDDFPKRIEGDEESEER
jgi:hypothetical protein